MVEGGLADARGRVDGFAAMKAMKAGMIGLVLGSLAAQAELEVMPAQVFRFVAEEGKFYQVEERKGEQWEAMGEAVRGEGEAVERVVTGGDATGRIRVRELHKQWVDQA